MAQTTDMLKICVAGLLPLAMGMVLTAQPVLAEPWKECEYNDQPIPCRDSHNRNGTVRIQWKDGKVMTYRQAKECTG